MPVLDTEVLFALNPLDKRHKAALKILSMKGLKAPDAALLEFQLVLRARGRTPREVAEAINALRSIMRAYGIREARIISTALLVEQLRIEENYGLSFFDSLIAASALALDGIIVSDDKDFDRVEGLRRIPLSGS